MTRLAVALGIAATVNPMGYIHVPMPAPGTVVVDPTTGLEVADCFRVPFDAATGRPLARPSSGAKAAATVAVAAAKKARGCSEGGVGGSEDGGGCAGWAVWDLRVGSRLRLSGGPYAGDVGTVVAKSEEGHYRLRFADSVHPDFKVGGQNKAGLLSHAACLPADGKLPSFPERYIGAPGFLPPNIDIAPYRPHHPHAHMRAFVACNIAPLLRAQVFRRPFSLWLGAWHVEEATHGRAIVPGGPLPFVNVPPGTYEVEQRPTARVATEGAGSGGSSAVAAGTLGGSGGSTIGSVPGSASGSAGRAGTKPCFEAAARGQVPSAFRRGNAF